MKALEASGIIAGYRAKVSRARAGPGLTIFIGLKVEKHSQETSTRIPQALLAIPAIVACYLVSGSSDLLVEAAVPDLASYELLLLGQILARSRSGRSSAAARCRWATGGARQAAG